MVAALGFNRCSRSVIEIMVVSKHSLEWRHASGSEVEVSSCETVNITCSFNVCIIVVLCVHVI